MKEIIQAKHKLAEQSRGVISANDEIMPEYTLRTENDKLRHDRDKKQEDQRAL